MTMQVQLVYIILVGGRLNRTFVGKHLGMRRCQSPELYHDQKLEQLQPFSVRNRYSSELQRMSRYSVEHLCRG